MEGAPPPPPPAPKVESSFVVLQEEYVKKKPKELGVLSLKPIHLLDDSVKRRVCDILCQKWPKADEHRMATFAKSSEDFPLTLVLLEDGIAIGHVLCSRVCEFDDAVLVESVIVDEALKGMGYGRRLMDHVHNYLKTRGFKLVFLSSSEKVDFYAHLGYEKCGPVTPVSSVAQLVDTEGLNALKAAFGGEQSKSFGRYVWMSLRF